MLADSLGLSEKPGKGHSQAVARAETAAGEDNCETRLAAAGGRDAKTMTQDRWGLSGWQFMSQVSFVGGPGWDSDTHFPWHTGTFPWLWLLCPVHWHRGLGVSPLNSLATYTCSKGCVSHRMGLNDSPNLQLLSAASHSPATSIFPSVQGTFNLVLP